MDFLFIASTFLVILAFISDILIILQILHERRLFIHCDGESPKASVIIPIRGSDECLESNVKSLLDQDYPDYELIYVVDTDQQALAERLSRVGVKVVFSDFQCALCSGKIRAQLSGLKSSSGDIIVFGDSDTRYDRGWLREMVGGLKKFDATTTYPWPSPTKFTLKNLVRSGFWTLGFESQFSEANRFLWGGSMAFRREFISRPDVIKELSEEWCDDCTLTRIIKRNKGKIGFLMNAMPLNVFNENDLIKWSSRQLITIRKYSPKGAKAYLFAGTLFLIFLVTSPLIPLNFTPYVLWIIKNLIRGKKYGRLAIVPSIMTIFAIPYALFLLVYNWNRSEVIWRGKKYVVSNRR